MQSEEDRAPMLSVFGSMFALMLVFLVVINTLSEASVRERLREGEDEGDYRIQRMDGGSGYVVIVFPNLIRIVETDEKPSQRHNLQTRERVSTLCRAYLQPGERTAGVFSFWKAVSPQWPKLGIVSGSCGLIP